LLAIKWTSTMHAIKQPDGRSMNNDLSVISEVKPLSGSSKSIYSHLPGCSAALAAKELSSVSGVSILVCATDKQAEILSQELNFFVGKDRRIIWEPDTGTLPYDTEGTPAERKSLRESARHALLTEKTGLIFITSASNILKKELPAHFWRESTVTIGQGDKLEATGFISSVEELGYKNDATEVSEPGQYVKNNNIVDIFPFGHPEPIRVKFDSGVISAIVSFDPISQLDLIETSSAVIMTARGYPWAQRNIDAFISGYRHAHTHESLKDDDFYQEIRAGGEPSGIENFIQFFGEELETRLSWVAPGTTFVFMPGAQDAINAFWNNVHARYDDLSLSKEQFLVLPQDNWVSPEELVNELAEFPAAYLHAEDADGAEDCGIIPVDFVRQKDLDATVDMLEPWVNGTEKTLLCVNSSTRYAQAQLLATVLGRQAAEVESWDEFIQSESTLCIAKNAIDLGCFFPDAGILVVDERGIFGQPILEGQDQTISADFNSIKDLKNLSPGDPLVHERFGVGRFIDMFPLEIDGITRDYLRVAYAEEATAYVGMDELNKVDRYGGLASEKTPLHVMGSDDWKKALKEAQADAIETAKGLLALKKIRLDTVGISFKKPNYQYNEFCSYFPYRETRDQLTAVQDVVTDMQAECPMDRVVCGDVGFGKTEVAMRAACLAVVSGYQAAILVPTTLLCEQHYESFRERFNLVGMTVVKLSSSSTAKEQASALEKINSGEADVIVGTQRLLMDDVSWASIGLLVIDEEHRFGVGDKDKLKDMRSYLDTLSMTATPIPRTMTMGLQGLRGFSVISTPPAKRLSVRTLLCRETDSPLKEGIQRELARGGQVFLLHNNTKTIKSRAEHVAALIPGLRVTYAHGKLSDKEMTARMRDFVAGEYDVLVATTIIEIGIDVPNANTIFIDNAQNMGLAQLHQLRGRVGRSSRQAYCYLITPETISETADTRLTAITKASRLGEGFILAYHDMEIRGAGELLGEKQSGNIQAVSFNLYMRLLAKAISGIEAGRVIEAIFGEDESTYIDLHATGLIPSEYISNSSLRLSYYKRLAMVDDDAVLAEIEQEMVARFGGLPTEAKDLMTVLDVRCGMQFVGVKKLNIGEKGGEMVLREHGAVTPKRLLKVVDKVPGSELSGPRSINFNCELKSLKERASFATKAIQWLIR
jgi:transcription-repair coupling factor (superfamily II helicase)